MQVCLNELGQPVGQLLEGWSPPPFPTHEPMLGRTCVLEPLDPERHAHDLYGAYAMDETGAMWTYLPVGPFADRVSFDAFILKSSKSVDPQFYAIIDLKSGKAVGFSSFMRIDPMVGCIEVGFLTFSPLMQRSTVSTEAMYLMMKRAFELGYRRYEWKCNACNEPSKTAALRLGFTYEGLFRQAIVVKGRNRDTAWYSIIDSEWPGLKAAFERWLDPANFDADGRQIVPLRELMAGGKKE